jgi:hypothetical protein
LGNIQVTGAFTDPSLVAVRAVFYPYLFNGQWGTEFGNWEVFTVRNDGDWYTWDMGDYTLSSSRLYYVYYNVAWSRDGTWTNNPWLENLPVTRFNSPYAQTEICYV